MKKLLALLLSMIMVLSLTAPAFAAPKELVPPTSKDPSSLGIIGGADGPTAIITSGPIDGSFSWWTAEEAYLDIHPGLEDQLRAGAYDYFSQSHPYESAQEYMDRHGMSEEDFLHVMVYEQLQPMLEMGLKAQYQQIFDLQKEALGGVAGQVGVMVDGKYIQFPGAAPELVDGRTMAPVQTLAEALGGEVSYGDREDLVRLYIDEYTILITIGSTTVEVMPRGTETGKENKSIELGCAPYVKDGHTYVPVRFIGEALGYEVGWDSQFQTAILLDRGALAAEIDKEFTILNKVLAASALSREEGKSYRTEAKGSVTVTAFDTLNGDKTYTADLSSKLLMDAEAASGSWSFTVSDDLVGLFADQYGLDEEEVEQMRLMLKVLERAEIVMTREGLAWVHAPALDELAGEENVWCGMDLGAELAQAAFASPGTATVGSLYAANLTTDSVLSSGTAAAGAADIAAVVGDSRFTTSGGVSTLTIGLDDVDPDGVEGLRDQFKELELRLTVDSKGGATMNCKLETEAQYGTPAMKLAMDWSLSAGKSSLTMDLHVSNLCQMKLALTAAQQATGDKPMGQPPKGANIVDAPALLAS